MKWRILLATLVAAVSWVGIGADSGSGAGAGKGKLRHVVAFKFKPTASPEQIQKVEEAFLGLKKSIPQIAEIEWGINNSPEKHNKGCTHGFILTFRSEADRDAYLPHPEHKKFGALVGPLLDDVFVIDFWAR